ncbi:hypothetical protein MCSF7_01981 [Mycoplasmopsis columbina SF7]|uniref:DUF3899 domain-containing protein n=1 Tax=Mycoplasmopsis columbina SF7 TaxID=1037410 RepID=F9UKI3_9BACT|nr:hypothetical protein [Mycoplasmopsis columbina]EGV00188.1 hypothetical protein MCSF7_01981 [Mycoplasmopsis columbina SF7]
MENFSHIVVEATNYYNVTYKQPFLTIYSIFPFLSFACLFVAIILFWQLAKNKKWLNWKQDSYELKKYDLKSEDITQEKIKNAKKYKLIKTIAWIILLIGLSSLVITIGVLIYQFLFVPV